MTPVLLQIVIKMCTHFQYFHGLLLRTGNENTQDTCQLISSGLAFLRVHYYQFLMSFLSLVTLNPLDFIDEIIQFPFFRSESF